MGFIDRKDAGRQLAQQLNRFKGQGAIVIAIPRGGVVIGAEVAAALEAPLSAVFVRKISDPSHPERTIGAVTEHEPAIYDETQTAEVGAYSLTQAEEATRELLKKRRQMYFGDQWKRPDMTGKVVILVDDGISTGLTMRAAVQTVRASSPSSIIIAVPTISTDSITTLRPLVDHIIALERPIASLFAVGAHYINFEEVTDDEVKKILHTFAKTKKNSAKRSA